MRFRSLEVVGKAFRSHARRALIVTTVKHESLAVRAHLADVETLVGDKGTIYEYGRFPDPAGEWLIVHAITPQGNSAAGLVASKAHSEFGSFHAQLFVGVAGSLKADIPIGSVVLGDYVHNGHAGKVEDEGTLGRPLGLPAARELLAAARHLVYTDEWQDLIRAPHKTRLPQRADYPCAFPPLAVIKGIVSGEEVVAGGKSPRFAYLRTHFNNCGAVEMEGWGFMTAAYQEDASAIVVRGISDMCAGKDHVSDELHQPIAAAHAAAFAFAILSFQSKLPSANEPAPLAGEAPTVEPEAEEESGHRRVEFVLNFEDSREDWPPEKIEAVVARLRKSVGDEDATLVRVEGGSVRLVVSVREGDLPALDLPGLRRTAAEAGATLLGASSTQGVREAESAREALASASANLLAWDRTLPNGRWIERPERGEIEERFLLDASSTVLLGEPGSGKSAVLSRVASDLLAKGAAAFGLKADVLSPDIATEHDLQRELGLPAPPSELILRLAAWRPVFVLVDQLDALANQLDLRSGRLNVLLNLVRRIGGAFNVHVLLSARTFEFNHDVRLRAVSADALSLALPPWHEVKEQLAVAGVDAGAWPDKARDVARIPQALKLLVSLAGAGLTEPFTTYQAMLERLWRDRIASAPAAEALSGLASDMAGAMAEEEVLWLAASRFDGRPDALRSLESLGFVIRSDDGFSVAFSHQTVFEHVLARTFVRKAELLSEYVLKRQDSLFVRAKIWSALSYLRAAEAGSYERDFRRLWHTEGLRKHLRLLLIDFLSQVARPLSFEKTIMAEVLRAPDLRVLGLKAVALGRDWFPEFASTAVRDAMSGSPAEIRQAVDILVRNWESDADLVLRLVVEVWLPLPERDERSWAVLAACGEWTEAVERAATTVVRRGPISVWEVDHAASTLAVTQPATAARLVRAKLDLALAEARSRPAPREQREGGRFATYYERQRWGRLDDLLDATEWHNLPALAETSPREFLLHLWDWYVSAFEEIVSRSEASGDAHVYPGRYVLETEPLRSESRRAGVERPLMASVAVAVEELAGAAPADFLTWVATTPRVEILAAQQLVAGGFAAGAARLSSEALDWLLADERRFQLGTSHGYRQTTTALIGACAPHWSEQETVRLEEAVLSYRPAVPGHLTEPEVRKTFANIVRATRKEVLQALGIDRLSTRARDLVAVEERALGDRFDRLVGKVEGGFVGSPMGADAMAKARDRDILRILREVPDGTNWDHPTHWMRGGSIQLSRSFAEFGRKDPERALRLMEHFEPTQQERAAGYALDAMADDAPNDARVLNALFDLHKRGFRAEEFRESAARAVEKVAGRKADMPEAAVAVLAGWLDLADDVPDEEGDAVSGGDPDRDEPKEGSILWGLGGASVLPGGNFTILSALASVLLGRGDAGRDRYFGMLDRHLLRERNPKVWKALLYRLGNSGGATPGVVSSFMRKLFRRFPSVLRTREAVVFLAYAQRWDDRLVFDLVGDWRDSELPFLRRAYGELTGLVATAKDVAGWSEARDDILASGAEDARIGLAHAAANMWSDAGLRRRSGAILVALLAGATKGLVAAVMDVFRVADEVPPDAATADLLRALADPEVDLTAAPTHFVVEHLQSLLPHEADLVAALAERLAASWRSDLSDLRKGTALAAPQLTDLALTLHRLGGRPRQVGIALFEAMIEIDAYGARETLAEVDGRFGPRQPTARPRLRRTGLRARRGKV